MVNVLLKKLDFCSESLNLKVMFKVIRYLISLTIIVCLMVVACYFDINWQTKTYLYGDIDALPPKRVALVLGTSKYLMNGRENEFYQNRIKTAAELFHAERIDYFVVSGDNRKQDYNEPQQMLADLVDLGVPLERIQPDYAGFRTLDSVLRMDRVFGHKEYVIISQQFHNQRALFLARFHGQSPIAFNAQNPQRQGMKKVLFREVFARVKAVIDLIVGKQAKFYGDKIIFPPKAKMP